MSRLPILLAIGAVFLAPPASIAAQPVARSTAAVGATSRPLVVRPDGEESLQWAASVVEMTPLRRQGAVAAKLFGTAGGDPAMNGLYTYLAFFEASPDEGWRVFRLGDFLSYRVVAESPGRVTLEVRESVMDERSGDIGARTRRLIVSWRGGGEAPATVTVATAR